MDQPISGTPITGQCVADHLKAHFGPHAILESFEVDKIGIGQGLISNILRLTLKWTVEDGLPRTVVLKVPTIEQFKKTVSAVEKTYEGRDVCIDTTAQWISLGHNVECKIYDLFEVESPILIPKCYGKIEFGEGKQGMLILEDFSEKAATSPSVLDGMTLGQLEEAVDQIARLEAWGMTTTTDWRSQIPAFEDRSEIMRKYAAPMLAKVAAVKAKYPDYFQSVDMDKVSKIRAFDHYLDVLLEHRAVMDDVLTHADFHMNNILYEKNNDGTVGDKLAAVIDFQDAIQGSPVCDLVRILGISLTPDLRRKHQDDLLRRYHTLVTTLCGAKFKATYEQICFWYKRHLAMEAIFHLSFVPMMFVLAVQKENRDKEESEKQYLGYVKDLYEYAISAYE